jgi:diguanylate cyclase (GGDEF)-like protein
VLASAGPDGPPLRGLAAGVIADLLGWVEHGGSSRTSSDRRAAPGPAQAALAATGLRSFVLVPLAARGEMLGGLVVGDGRHDEAQPETVETMELLAALAAADLRSLRAADVLRRQARTDHLTGLPHRRAFEQALDDALAARDAADLAVVLIDLDGFKAINAEHGHQAGDGTLSKAARALAAALRADDALYRIGGDEFAALLPVPDDGQLAAIADRLLQAARCACVTVSIGAAQGRRGRRRRGGRGGTGPRRRRATVRGQAAGQRPRRLPDPVEAATDLGRAGSGRARGQQRSAVPPQRCFDRRPPTGHW